MATLLSTYECDTLAHALNCILLTNSMDQSPSSEANSHSASQEIPCLLQNRKVHYRIHEVAPLVPILSQLHPVHTFPSRSFKIQPNIILSSTPKFSE
jgi:hypothetical protein